MKKLHIGDIAPNGTALNSLEEEVELATYWPSGPLLLTFLRHFG